MKEKDVKAKKLIDVGREGSILKTPSGGTLAFARAGETDWERIKKLSKSKLVKEYKELCSCVKHCVSVSDMQILSLMELEMESRGVSEEDLEEDE